MLFSVAAPTEPVGKLSDFIFWVPETRGVRKGPASVISSESTIATELQVGKNSFLEADYGLVTCCFSVKHESQELNGVERLELGNLCDR